MRTADNFYIKKIRIPAPIVRLGKKLPAPVKNKIKASLAKANTFKLAVPSRPKISIIIPVYNNSDYIKSCIDSALDQDYRNIEVVIVDDHSTETDVKKILNTYQKNKKAKIFFNPVNLGISLTQNQAIFKSTGDFIAFLDCDDILPKGAIKTAVKYITFNKECAYFYSDRVHIDNNGKEIDRERFNNRDHGHVYKELLKGMFTSHLKVIRRDVFLKTGLHQCEFDGSQDYDIALKAAENYSFCYMPKFLYKHRIHSSQTTQKTRDEQVAIVKKIKEQSLLRKKIREGKVGKTTIVILSFNRRDSLQKCLQAIKDNTKIPYEILLFDNGSEQETKKYLATLEKEKNIKVVYSDKNLGCPGGRAKAVKMATSDYVVTLDNDIEVKEGWLEAFLFRIEENENIGGACARLMLPNGSLEFNGGALIEDKQFVRFELRDRGKSVYDISTMVRFECGWLPGGATIYKKAVTDQICHDSNYVNAYEDNDYSFQAKKNGYRLVNCPEALMVHNHSDFTNEKNKEYLEMRRNRFIGGSLLKSMSRFYLKWDLAIDEQSSFENMGINELSKDQIIKVFKNESKKV